MRLWLAVLALGGSLAGQSTARIEGRVVSQSGEPVRKATVRLQGGQLSYVAISDSAGRFAIDGLAPGRYTISASRAGFVRTQTNTSITLQAGQARTDLEIKLRQLGFISGQVTDQDGDPVFGARIQAMRPEYAGTQRQWVSVTPVVSDERGNFRILNVDQGRYYVMALNASAQGFLATDRLSRSAQQSDVPTFYPSASEVSAAVAVQVGAGQDVQGVNIRMVRARLFSIAGKAVDGKTGVPGEMQLSLTKKGAEAGLPGSNYGLASRPATGAFEIRGLQAGTYVLNGRPQQTNVSPNAIANYAGHQEITISESDVDGIVFALPDPLEITGTVRVESGDLKDILPAPCPPAGCRRGTIGPSIGLVDLDERFGMSPSGPLEPEGTFKISNISWSRYTVTPLGFSGDDLYLKSMRFGGQDAIKNPLDLTSGAGGVLELLYSHRAAEVDASVHDKDGKVVTNVSVSLWPKTPLAFDPFRGQVFRTNPEQVEITNVPPGEYYVAAWDSVDPALLMYSELLARFVSQAATVKVGESDKVSVDLTLIPKDKIAAEVARLP